MADDKDELRLYGTPDEAKRAPPPAQGLRGEQGAPLAEPPVDLTHHETVAGRPIAVEESSGTAFAEATGKAGPDAQRRKADDPGPA